MSTKPAPRRGRPPLVENHREVILERAAVLFGTYGYQGVGIAALADDLGVSKAALFHYFKSKREIFDSIVYDALSGLYEFVTTSVSEDDDPSTQLVTFMRCHAQFFEENYWKFVVMLVGFGGITSPLASEMKKIRDNYEKRLREIIARGEQEGAFREVDVAMTGRAVLSMLNWMARWYKPGGKRSAADFAEDYASLLLAGLSAD
jgi:TetR/AcrR family transcriptional regulator, cholesterol catabolism regulator